MTRGARICAVALLVMTSTAARAGDTGPGEVDRPHFLSRLGPRGGCNPDGRGIFHWWNRDCYPRPCGPDNYCRKPMPDLCWRYLHPAAAGHPRPPFPAPLQSP
jgi:hypothetical protein